MFKTHVPCTRFITSAAIRGSISIAVTCFAFSKIFTVKFPVPGPTSKTLSVGLRFACVWYQFNSVLSRAGKKKESELTASTILTPKKKL
jgi:hypothetical protein